MWRGNRKPLRQLDQQEQDHPEDSQRDDAGE